MGAVPLAGAIAQLSWLKGHPIAAFFVRKKPKEHGARLAVEGLAKGESLQGKRIVIVEDVTTTGGSALKAVEAVRDAGGEIVLVFTMVDREEGADRNLRRSRPAVSLAVQGQRVFEGLIFYASPACGRVDRYEERCGGNLSRTIRSADTTPTLSRKREREQSISFRLSAARHRSFTIPH